MDDKLSSCGISFQCLEEESKTFAHVFIENFHQEGTVWQDMNHPERRYSYCRHCGLSPDSLSQSTQL